MKELEHDLIPLIRSLFFAWTSQAPRDPVQRAWFFIWTILVFVLGFVIIGVSIEAINLARTNPPLLRVILSNLKEKSLTAVESLRIGVHKPFRLPLLVCMVALFFAAVGDFPYDFYLLLRVAIFFISSVEFVMLREQSHHAWSGVFVLVALLYNPFVPLPLHRSTWVVINWAALILFSAVCGLMKTTLAPTSRHK